MKRILSFFKKDAVLTAAWTLAILSMAAVPPSIRYISYLDLHTLGLLFCLMATMAGLQAMGFFHQMGESLLMRIHSLRQLEMLLVLLCFFSSMFITNDVALITFVPFAIELLKMIRREDRLIPVVVLQTIAANLGSMATPIGNPQNLYLYSTTRWEWAAFSRPCCPLPSCPCCSSSWRSCAEKTSRFLSACPKCRPFREQRHSAAKAFFPICSCFFSVWEP